MLELTLARWKFGRLDIDQLLGSARSSERACPPSEIGAKERQLIQRVSHAIQSAGSRLPFRTDCLIQAMAAQRWLKRHGISSSLSIGVRKNAAEPFGAHAWLARDDQVITGGDISGYELMIGPRRAAESAARP